MGERCRSESLGGVSLMKEATMEDARLAQLDQELTQSIRHLTITPAGYFLTGWTKAQVALLLQDLAEQIAEEAIEEMLVD